MDLKTMRATAKKNMNGTCRVCPVVMAGSARGKFLAWEALVLGESFTENVRSLAKLGLNMRTIRSTLQPRYDSIHVWPIIEDANHGGTYHWFWDQCGGAIGELEMVTAIVEGSTLAGSLGWIGDPANASMYEDGLAAIRAGKQGIAIIKPRIDSQKFCPYLN